MAKVQNAETATPLNFVIRRAGLSDVNEIAAAHADSIRSLGSHYYEPDVVGAWSDGLEGPLYAQAMARGEVFFIAVDRLGEQSDVLGFSTHRVDDNVHGTAVYVRGKAARRGVGSALLRAAEANARAAGAATIEIDASLAAVDFYTALGFVEIGRGMHALPSGQSMPCVFMRKELAWPR
jgi:GNAT superfamily N-acetyltransferase